MRKTGVQVVSGMVVVILASGCTTLGSRSQQDRARVQYEVDQLKRDVARLQLQVEQVTVAQERLTAEQERTAVSVEDRSEVVTRSVDELDGKIARLADLQNAMRTEIIEKITQRISALMQERAVAAAPPAASGTGYEHVVRPGETLSEIARAYNVSQSVIIRVNNLNNPDALRVGQKLFIPE